MISFAVLAVGEMTLSANSLVSATISALLLRLWRRFYAVVIDDYALTNCSGSFLGCCVVSAPSLLLLILFLLKALPLQSLGVDLVRLEPVGFGGTPRFYWI